MTFKWLSRQEVSLQELHHAANQQQKKEEKFQESPKCGGKTNIGRKEMYSGYLHFLSTQYQKMKNEMKKLFRQTKIYVHSFQVKVTDIQVH